MKIHVVDQVYDFDLQKLLVSEAIFIQEKTRMKVGQWRDALGEGDAVAIKALVYILKWRAGENPDWNTLDFDLAALTVEDDAEPEPEEAAPLGAGVPAGAPAST